MTSAFIIHGRCDPDEYYSSAYPSLSNSHWLPWLQKQLLMCDIFTQTPEMPGACRPVYTEWKSYFNRIVKDDEDLILIGHSCGAGFLLRWLSETKRLVSKTVLVAPWLDPTKQGADPEFFNFELDYTIKERTDLHIVASDNDMDDIVESVRIVREAFPEAGFHLFQGYGHFCLSDMKTGNFPELLKIVVGDAPITNSLDGSATRERF